MMDKLTELTIQTLLDRLYEMRLALDVAKAAIEEEHGTTFSSIEEVIKEAANRYLFVGEKVQAKFLEVGIVKGATRVNKLQVDAYAEKFPRFKALFYKVGDSYPKIQKRKG